MTTAHIMIIHVPDLDKDPRNARRVIEQNFRAIAELVNIAVSNGSLIGPGTITLAMLADDAKTLVGDVNGFINANVLNPDLKVLQGDVVGAIGTVGEGGSTTVEKIQNVPIPAPGAANDLQFIQYNDTTGEFQYAAASGGSGTGIIDRERDTDLTLNDTECFVSVEYLRFTGSAALILSGDAVLRIIN